MTLSHRQKRESARPRRTSPRTWIACIGGGLLLAAMLALAACGGTTYPGARPSPTVTTSAYAYLYSRIDYPLELAVNAGSTVTLTLSPHQNLLTATPSAGSGVGTVGEPISLPTRLQDYNDIGAAVDTDSAANSPVVWQLTSAQRQSLLTPGSSGTPRRYLDDVAFRWHVEAVAPGQNRVRIILHLYYIYLDGSEHDGTIQVSASPMPIVASQPTFIDTTLPQLRLPLAGLSGLAGLLGVLRFFWDLFQNAKDAKDTAQSVVRAAAAIHTRVNQRRQP